MKENLRYAKYQQILANLKEKTIRLLENSNNNGLVNKLVEDLKESSERNELKLAFVGQYSSGKSTIISALTGNKDIKIDTNISTDVVSEYRWNNIILMDTPGILAGKVEQHDESTKEALKECDLIFYVLTSQLFDDILFNNFIDLAYNQHLADKMFIIINKMGMEDGEFNQLSQNYTKSLDDTFKARGYNLSSFPIAFIDANDYIDGIEDEDEEFITLSNFVNFIEMLNSFVSQKGLIKKQFDTPIRILQGYLKNIAVSEIDDKLAEFYRQFEQKLIHSENDMQRDVTNILTNFDANAMTKVLQLSSSIGESDETQWKIQQNLLNDSLGQLIQDTSSKIEKNIENNYKTLMQQVEEFCSKDSLKSYNEHIDNQLNSPNISIEEYKTLSIQKSTLNWLTKGAQGVSNLAPGVNSIFDGISHASGSELHNIVLNVGHFFGKNFRPWEAVRWASNVAKVAKFGIPVLTTGIDIWMQYKEEKKEERRAQQIKESKNQFITGYQIEFDKIKEKFEQYLLKVLQNYTDKRQEINRSKDEIIKLTQKNTALNNSIKDLESEYVEFIEILDSES